MTDLDGDEDDLQNRLKAVRSVGVPNYFGPQRFGIRENNLRLARAMLVEGARVKDRSKRAFAYSAARAFLFNVVLSRRVQEGTWNCLLPGDVANLEGSRSTFLVDEPDDAIKERLGQMDIHPTGPLWGAGASRARGEVLALERAECSTHPLALGLERNKLESTRRSLRLPVHELEWCLEPSVLTVSFRLTVGGYATSVLREIIRVDTADGFRMS